ncbi:sarcoplasmic calcium-binding protein, beta chain [Eurytemora carolleeae]|uniref:sarcoplasmic calcium-binding protein, beta chain n=1 Tax=Eurytemora carolleeae TaxID=1294199 RepID=UPI000C78ADAB|nr:sarcoplasmic calcium-binding protein, beta chain [Eurytemora carolleeae]|eukprot:XP_023336618.1 sarcoplasmic calcium-binding protein, beta chain-like [Eurytemora affinis]
MANSWTNRVKFLVRYMYDIDNNGVLDKTDFECLAVKNTIMEGKGSWDATKYAKNKEVMINLWDQIAEIADFDKNGEVDSDEFMKGVETACKGKAYADLPNAFKFFIEAQFRTIDVDGDGSIGLDEFRYDCVNRMPVKEVTELDAAFSKISLDGDITLPRYQVYLYKTI